MQNSWSGPWSWRDGRLRSMILAPFSMRWWPVTGRPHWLRLPQIRRASRRPSPMPSWTHRSSWRPSLAVRSVSVVSAPPTSNHPRQRPSQRRPRDEPTCESRSRRPRYRRAGARFGRGAGGQGETRRRPGQRAVLTRSAGSVESGQLLCLPQHLRQSRYPRRQG